MQRKEERMMVGGTQTYVRIQLILQYGEYSQKYVQLFAVLPPGELSWDIRRYILLYCTAKRIFEREESIIIIPYNR